jgi:hypothetical protein
VQRHCVQSVAPGELADTDLPGDPARSSGARAKVKEIELNEIDAEPVDAGGIAAVATWTVNGSAGHWGHIHQRSNQYPAELTVRPLDGAWKLTEIEILEEERL